MSAHERAKAYLDCPDCGEEAIPSNADGLFHEDMPIVTCSCGARVRVVVDEWHETDGERTGVAYADTVTDE
jgi:hypothetical protein